MRKMMKTGMIFFMAMLVLMTQHVTADAKAKVLNKKMTIDLNKDSAGLHFAPTKLKRYSKVKVSVKNKKVLKAKAKGRKYIYLKGKAGGRTTIIRPCIPKPHQFADRPVIRAVPCIAAGKTADCRRKP